MKQACNIQVMCFYSIYVSVPFVATITISLVFDNALQAVVQMQSALESLVAAVQQQANDQQAQHRAAMEAQQQQTTELKLAFLRQANELAALQTAVARSSASRSQALLTEVSEASACTMQVMCSST